MKLKKIRVFLTFLLVINALIYFIYKHNEYYKHSLPPPGWKILTDNNGHYGAQFPDNGFILTTFKAESGVLMTSPQEAINAAWKHYDFQQKQKELIITNWFFCNYTNK